MKRAIILIIWVAASLGCSVPNDSSIRWVGAHPLKLGPQGASACQAQDVQIVSGSLDLAGNSNYDIVLNLESNLESITTAAPETVAGPSRNDFNSKYIVRSYKSNPPVPFQTDQQGLTMTIKAGASAQSFLRYQLFTANAQNTLYANVPVPGCTGGAYSCGLDVDVTVQVFGELASGQKISTNKLTFPIRVYKSGPVLVCPSPDIQAPTGPCGAPGGQDGTDVACCSWYKAAKLTPPSGCPTT
jgi:hypothetical protein